MRNIYLKVRDWLSPSAKARIRYLVSIFFNPYAKKFYSQFGEDSVIWSYFVGKEFRIKSVYYFFESIKLDAGFYVDIGAFSPIQHSNTYAFYKAGWSGINIDPTPGSMKIFNLQRKRDVNLEVGITSSEGREPFYMWSSPCVVNTFSKSQAERYAEHIGRKPIEVEVPTYRLETVLDQYLPKDVAFKLLSIDVEGIELDVLKSNNWEKYKPTLIVIELLERDIEQILDSEVHSFLIKLNYKLYAWAPYSLIYELQE